MSRRKKIALLIVLSLAVVLHGWLIWLGGPWRVFALVEAGMGVLIGLIVRDFKKLDLPAPEADQKSRIPEQ